MAAVVSLSRNRAVVAKRMFSVVLVDLDQSDEVAGGIGAVEADGIIDGFNAAAIADGSRFRAVRIDDLDM